MTQHYIGTKIITAWESEKDGVDGYAVKYSDGYTSWSPKGVFEAAYVAMGHVGSLPPHVQRVIGEKANLDAQRSKLLAFFETDLFKGLSPKEQQLLVTQATCMGEYSEILADRLAEHIG